MRENDDGKTVAAKTGTTDEIFLDNPMEDLDIPIFLRRRENKNKQKM